jgi:hypothetical protein
MGKKMNMYRFMAGKPEGERSPGRPRRRWIDNIKMDLLEIRLGGIYCIGLAQGRYSWRAIVNSLIIIWAP